ncbi:putative isoprenylcysteine alpha-carbonyl methylesterase ICMEL1 [Fusarium austroafricanum]|uniref:Putative isoprenylcysteine alpha-carbonyl methylesterase ICMEL1 n=1 Tax=Fusarium austroafricanum TaxID=2364996 RepID=A0A8H4P2L4_9HYPO|nr:putative isoprenylcysteine alpha-carbonyl methylesterase ICMEL1 [Fusarium austroafricanum]
MSSPSVSTASEPADTLSPGALAARGREITGLSIFRNTSDDITAERVTELMSQMNSDVPQGGLDMKYGPKEAQRLRLWKPSQVSTKTPVVVYVHGGSWRIGTYLDSTGAKKVNHLNELGYAFASINYTLIPEYTVEDQVQEVADSVAYLIKNATEFNLDSEIIVLMGHSSGAHVVTLIGTDPSYAKKAGFAMNALKGIIALDGSNYNALAEFADSSGPILTNMIYGLSDDPERLKAMSPTYHAAAPNAGAFLLLHVQRKGGIRQAVELSAALKAAGTEADLHVFEGEFFEGHVAMLLRLGDASYPATLVMDSWLKKHVPVN